MFIENSCSFYPLAVLKILVTCLFLQSLPFAEHNEEGELCLRKVQFALSLGGILRG